MEKESIQNSEFAKRTTKLKDLQSRINGSVHGESERDNQAQALPTEIQDAETAAKSQMRKLLNSPLGAKQPSGYGQLQDESIVLLRQLYALLPDLPVIPSEDDVDLTDTSEEGEEDTAVRKFAATLERLTASVQTKRRRRG